MEPTVKELPTLGRGTHSRKMAATLERKPPSARGHAGQRKGQASIFGNAQEGEAEFRGPLYEGRRMG